MWNMSVLFCKLRGPHIHAGLPWVPHSGEMHTMFSTGWQGMCGKLRRTFVSVQAFHEGHPPARTDASATMNLHGMLHTPCFWVTILFHLLCGSKGHSCECMHVVLQCAGRHRQSVSGDQLPMRMCLCTSASCIGTMCTVRSPESGHPSTARCGHK